MPQVPLFSPPAERSLSARSVMGGLLGGAAVGAVSFAALMNSHISVHGAAWLGSQSHTILGAGWVGLTALAGWGGARAFQTHKELQSWREAYRSLQRTSMTDPITGLSNQLGLESKASLSLARMHRGHGPVSLLIVRLGSHLALPAESICAIAERLARTLRASDSVARLADGDFGILAELRTPEDAAILAERLINELKMPIAGMDVAKLQVRIGIAIAPDDADSAPTLLQRARKALETSARDGASTFSFFSRDMQTRSRQREELRHMVIEAVAHRQITLNYQPLVELESRKIVGFEAFARWAPPGRRQIPPSFFIPAAEDSGVIGMLTDQLFTQACTAAAMWPSDQVVAMNLSPRQLRDKMLVNYVKNALETSFLPGNRLELELTEEALRDMSPQVRDTLLQIKELGVRLVLDDSGLGASGLAALQAIPFDKIKICTQRTAKQADGSEGAHRLATLLATAKALSIPLVAESVETEIDANKVSEMGCVFAQGWWFGHPIPADYVKAIFTPLQF